MTANQVTLLGAVGSVALGGVIVSNVDIAWLFFLIPAWFPVRMALNAIDGLLAREFNQKSPLGTYLNEISDIISDAALYLPFAFVAPFDGLWVGTVIFLSVISEFVSVIGPMVGATRRYDGPIGKSDRALIFGGLGFAVGLASTLPLWAAWIMPGLALLLCLTVVNRIRGGLSGTEQVAPPRKVMTPQSTLTDP